MVEPISTYQKPTFDGRIQFYNELNDILHRAGLFSAMKDLEGWYRSLCSAISQVSGLIEPDKEKALKVTSDKLRKRIYNHPNFKSAGLEQHYWQRVDKEMNDFDNDFHIAAKHLMLPLESLNTGEFDEDQFFRESDLTQ